MPKLLYPPKVQGGAINNPHPMETKEAVKAQRPRDVLTLLRPKVPESGSSLSTSPSPPSDKDVSGEKPVLKEPGAHATEETPHRAMTFLCPHLGSLSARRLQKSPLYCLIMKVEKPLP